MSSQREVYPASWPQLSEACGSTYIDIDTVSGLAEIQLPGVSEAALVPENFIL